MSLPTKFELNLTSGLPENVWKMSGEWEAKSQR